MSAATIILRVTRPEGPKDYSLSVEAGMTVLDALETIRGRGEKDLRYRHSCHHGSCGTCGAVINGVEGLMCLKRLEDYAAPGDGAVAVVTVEPLGKMGAIGDLAVDPSPLFSSLPEGAAYLRASGLAHGGPKEEGGDYLRFEACIECGLCVSACPVMPEDKAFAGPAALAMADRDREERPERQEASLAFAARPDGVAACDKVFACSKVCPQGVAPGRRIQNLRKNLGER